MKQKLETIYETNIVHNSFLDKDSIIQAMVESYNLGKQELINWLSEKDYLSDDKKTLLKEYNNHFNNITK
jgi:phage antirepressor YoqD-like protein